MSDERCTRSGRLAAETQATMHAGPEAWNELQPLSAWLLVLVKHASFNVCSTVFAMFYRNFYKMEFGKLNVWLRASVVLPHGKGNFHPGGPRLPIITGNRYCIFTMVFHKCECATLNHAFLDVAWLV